VKEARAAIKKHPEIRKILADLKKWPGPALKNHKDAKHQLHKLSFIADLGLDKRDKEISEIAEIIMQNQSEEGPFQILVNIPKVFGGSGKDERTWIICDAVVSLYSLIKFGYKDDSRVKKALKYMTGLVQENGWRCTSSPDLGKFRGPGRKDDPCPYANFYMVKILAQMPEYHKSKEAQTGINTIFDLWKDRKKRKPYLFGMGTDFKKLKAPFIWYDILHFTDVLTRFKHLKDNKHLQQMLKIVAQKKDKDRKFMTESVYRAWKDWDFGQKREPSEWITLLASRVLKRVGR